MCALCASEVKRIEDNFDIDLDLDLSKRIQVPKLSKLLSIDRRQRQEAVQAQQR